MQGWDSLIKKKVGNSLQGSVCLNHCWLVSDRLKVTPDLTKQASNEDAVQNHSSNNN